jgi:hypothetical protein
MLRASPRLLHRAAGLIAGLAVITGVQVIGVTPAEAEQICHTFGHVYLTQPGRVYFSGYEGNQQNGIPMVVASQGELFRLGGNGLQEGTTIRFFAQRVPGPGQESGTPINFLTGSRDYVTQPARENCVVNEEGPYRLTAPTPGRYRVFAEYTSGNTIDPVTGQERKVFDVVADFDVLPGLPTPSSTSLLPSGDSDPSNAGPGPAPQPLQETAGTDMFAPSSVGDPGGGGGGGGGCVLICLE